MFNWFKNLFKKAEEAVNIVSIDAYDENLIPEINKILLHAEVAQANRIKALFAIKGVNFNDVSKIWRIDGGDISKVVAGTRTTKTHQQAIAALINLKTEELFPPNQGVDLT